MQMCDVELPAWGMGHQLVMLLQYLVKTLQGHGNSIADVRHMGNT